MNYSDLPAMTEGYIESALWSSLDYGPDENAEPRPMDDNYGPDDLAPDTRAGMVADCLAFWTANSEDLATMDAGQAGHDLWLTRNGHGAGFWDRGLGDLGDRLTDAAHVYGVVDLYVGDDGKVHA